MIMPSNECNMTLLVISQHWFRWWLGAFRQHAITWANVDLVLCRYIVSLGHNALILFIMLSLYNGCWWPDDVRRQDILSHGFDLVCLSGLNRNPGFSAPIHQGILCVIVEFHGAPDVTRDQICIRKRGLGIQMTERSTDDSSADFLIWDHTSSVDQISF